MDNDERITLYFNTVCISFIDTAERIRAKRYDFSQFGPIISGTGKDWEVVARGCMSIKNFDSIFANSVNNDNTRR